jgi:PLP dependent protein
MSIAENLTQVQRTIAAACDRARRDPHSVTLLAVSKTHPASLLIEAMTAGVQHFGENRVEEAETKVSALQSLASESDSLVWHMVGHIQSRKARDVAALFEVVHSVDSLKLGGKLSAACMALNKSIDVLLEVNVSGEASKSGFAAANWQQDERVLQGLAESVRSLSILPGLRVRGFMTMAPIVPEAESARPVFQSLRLLRDELEQRLGMGLSVLSMGMTDDYPVAIEEGATIVRIGRAIFGERERLK